MEKNYVFNLETTKIELYFDKEEYLNLTENEKKELKSKFLFSGKRKCWISRAKEPNLYFAKEVAKKLGFEKEERVGKRITYSEQLEQKAECAEERAIMYETYSENAINRAENLQKPINDVRGDIAFFTQPIISGHSGSQAFAKRREKMFNRYKQGFDEYRKSEYFIQKAITARETRDMKKLEDKGYLERKINECKKTIRVREKNVINYEGILSKLQKGEILKKYNGELHNEEDICKLIERELDLIEVAIDKECFFENKLESLGGICFSKENVKVGYIVEVKTYGMVQVISQGNKNITYKILTGGAIGLSGNCSYAEIKEIVKANELKPAIHPFKVDDVFQATVYKRDEVNDLYTDKVPYKIIKVTDKSIKLENQETKETIIRKPKKGFRDNWYFAIDKSYSNTFYK